MAKKIFLSFAFALLLAIGGGLYYGYNQVFKGSTNPSAVPYELYVRPGFTTDSVYQLLKADEVFTNLELFTFIAEKKGLTQVKSGHYTIADGTSINGLVNALKAGLQTPVKVHFNGAQDLRDIANQLSTQLMISSNDLYDALAQPLGEGWTTETQKGAYLPDTYEFYWNASGATVAQKIHENWKRYWSPERVEKASALGLTPQEVGVVASIVMKESAKVDERPQVARLYLNRIKKSMKLQADPTVIYALKRNNPDMEVRRVLTRDLRIQDPYNTYVNLGLPPGPICVPERGALDAVLKAPNHDYVFMCADPAKPGYHAFAKTYAKHLVNKAKWTAYLNNRRIYR